MLLVPTPFPSVTLIRPGRWKNCFSQHPYRDRNAIKRMFGRHKDNLRIATRYDRLATNDLAAVCLTAIVNYWQRTPVSVRPFRNGRIRLDHSEDKHAQKSESQRCRDGHQFDRDTHETPP